MLNIAQIAWSFSSNNDLFIVYSSHIQVTGYKNNRELKNEIYTYWFKYITSQNIKNAHAIDY